MTAKLFSVEVHHRCEPRLVDHSGWRYSSPPQPTQQALALVRALLAFPTHQLEPARVRGSAPSPVASAPSACTPRAANFTSNCCQRPAATLPGGLPARPDDHFHRALVGDLVGTIRGIAISHNEACPDCGRGFATTIKRLADPQLRLFVEE
jgi:hypothetical protein